LPITNASAVCQRTTRTSERPGTGEA
jgi:hypothetical protein